MTVATSSPLSDVSRRVLQLQVTTLIWMTVEALVSLGTAWTSHSPALLAFGGDSLIELLSAAVVFWRFRFALGEARAARIAGGLLFTLAGFVVLTSILSLIGYREVRRTLYGIGILVVAAVVMPWLASRKRKLAVVTSSGQLHGKPLSQNMAIRAGDAAIVLKTSRLAAAEGLPASTLEDLEQCAAVALLLIKE